MLTASENDISEKDRIANPDWSTMFMETVFQSVPSMLISTDSEGIVTHWNRAVGNFTGIGAEAAEGKPFWE